MKKCKSGYYYCNTDKKCKPIPRGYRVGYGGYLRKEKDDDDSKNKSNGNGNGNGNGSNGNGNGGNGSGGNGGGGNGGGMGEEVTHEAVAAIPAVASKVIPAAAATVGAIGTYMQARKSGKFTRKVMKGKVGENQKVKPDLLDAIRKKQKEDRLKKEKRLNTSPDVMDAMKQKQAEVDKIRKKKGRKQGVNMSPTKNRVTDKIDAGVFKRGKIIDKETRRRMNAPENQFNSYDPLKEEAPTNNASSGNIAGLPPDNPPVKRKKKKYAYGGRGSRKMWMNNK